MTHLNIEYKVIKAETLLSLEATVNSYLQAGWRLKGGVSSVEHFYIQAMTHTDISPNVPCD